MPDQTRKIDLGDHSIRFHSEGETGPTLLFAHGFADSSAVWKPVSDRFASHIRLRPEMRGHEFSTGPEGPYAWDDLGADILAVLDEAGSDRASLIGHGLGGIACLLAALQAPERIDRIVLLGTATEADAAQQNWCREIIKAGRMNALQGIAHAIFGPISRKPVDGTAGPMLELARCMESLADTPITSRMANIQTPTLVLKGEQDPAHSESLAEALPNGRLEILPGLSHFAHKNDPETVGRAIENFLSD